ncbi:hypothetical protein [Sulfurimonas sp.]|uniref:hypothetical protein n=1 Tax=Sulfurimonas sp. TaxID=2022749 RepID=UPI003D122BA8
MSAILNFLESTFKEKSLPLIYLVAVLYLFSIDIVVLILLGYQTKDIFYLLDMQKIILLNTIILTSFTMLMVMIKKHFIATSTIVILLAVFYAMSYDLDINDFLNPIIFLYAFFVALAHKAYDNWVLPWIDDNLLKLSFVNAMIGLIIATLTALYIDKNLDQWNNAKLEDGKIVLNRTSTPWFIVQPKSFNPIYLQSLNQDLKLFVNSNFAESFSQQIYKQDEIIDSDFIYIPHDGSYINNNIITIYYYNIDDIKNIFFISDKNGKTILHTLITKAINKNDMSKGYQLISEYSHEIKLHNTITQQAEASEVKGL